MSTAPRGRRRRPPIRAAGALLAFGVALASALPTGLGEGRRPDPDPRQITAFAMRADPGDPAIDPILSLGAAQLREVMPGHGFRFLGSASDALAPGRMLSCDLGDGHSLAVRYHGRRGGKARLTVRLLAEGAGRPVFVADVRTPAGQLVFLDKALPGTDARLLISLGVR